MEKLETLRGDKPKMSMKIMRKGESKSKEEWHEAGFQFGLLAAHNQTMAPRELETIQENYQRWKDSSGEESAAMDYLDKGVFRKWVESEVALYRQQHPGFAQDAYVAGWMEGVISIWRKGQ